MAEVTEKYTYTVLYTVLQKIDSLVGRREIKRTETQTGTREKKKSKEYHTPNHSSAQPK
jgi:hypothetical protein